MVYERFGRLKNGVDFDHVGLKLRVFFSFWLGVWYFAYKELFFFCINIGTFVALLKCLGKWSHFLLTAIIWVVCTNFGGLKWGIDFSLRSETRHGKSQSLVWNSEQASRFGAAPITLWNNHSPPLGRDTRYNFRFFFADSAGAFGMFSSYLFTDVLCRFAWLTRIHSLPLKASAKYMSRTGATNVDLNKWITRND